MTSRRQRPPDAPSSPTLFEAATRNDPQMRAAIPLAERMGPRTLDEVVGQRHLLAPASRWFALSAPTGCRR